MAAAYNAIQRELSPAPLVLGHPMNDKPTYGHVDSLFAKGEKLYAHAKVNKTLNEWVIKGRYRNVSSALYLRGAKENMNGSALGLKHVGFLGAWPPAVRNMDPLWQFAADGESHVRYGQFCEVLNSAVQGARKGFEVPPGYAIDPKGLKLLEMVQTYALACPDLSFIEAVNLASRYVKN